MPPRRCSLTSPSRSTRKNDADSVSPLAVAAAVPSAGAPEVVAPSAVSMATPAMPFSILPPFAESVNMACAAGRDRVGDEGFGLWDWRWRGQGVGSIVFKLQWLAKCVGGHV
eukprot:349787-Chlamydomonas_euryale.AAC.3